MATQTPAPLPTGPQPNAAPTVNVNLPDTIDAPLPSPSRYDYWVPAINGDGLSCDVDGAINFPGMRDAAETLDINVDTDGDTSPGHYQRCTKVKIGTKPLRMTVAIPTDHRLTYACKMSCDPTAKVDLINESESDVDAIQAPFRRVYLADCGELYAREIRGGLAWPIPQSVVTQNRFSPGLIRDDSKYIIEHARKKLRDVGRLDRGGGNPLYSPHILPAVSIGDQIKSLSNPNGSTFPVRACVVGITFDYEKQSTERHIA